MSVSPIECRKARRQRRAFLPKRQYQMTKAEFQEIGHTGGKVTFGIKTEDGHRAFNVTYSHSRPVASALFAVWALPQGVAVAGIDMGGIGTPWNPPPVPGCYPVLIASDSEGMFGHSCPQCSGYWRSRGGNVMCPYCGAGGDKHMLLTEAQQRYIQQYCETLSRALATGQDGDYKIDMDAVADAVGKSAPKPQFIMLKKVNKISQSVTPVARSPIFWGNTVIARPAGLATIFLNSKTIHLPRFARAPTTVVI